MCELQRIVGFQKEVKGGLIFYKQSTLFYLSGQTGVFHSLKDNMQKFLPINEKNEFTAMIIGEKHLLAFATKGVVPKLTVYNLKSADRFILPNPKKIEGITEYVYISFSEDAEYLAAQAGKLSWPFLIWGLKRKSLVGVFFPFRLEPRTKVFEFSFQPDDNENIIAVGRYFLRIYHHKSGARFKEEALHKFERSLKTFHSLTWIQKTDKFAVGTSDGTILIFEKKRLIQQISVDKKLADVPRILNKIGNPVDKNITNVLSSKRGIICTYGGDSVLCLRWTTDKKDFTIVSSVHIPKQVECTTEDSKIVQLILNSNEDTLAAATDDGQILTFSFLAPGFLDSIGYESEFDVILDRQHKTSIICASTAVNRAVHVTCSVSTLILWDYKKRQILLWKKFDDHIRNISIHPLGINLIVSFGKNCRMYNILYNELKEIQEFNTKDNSLVRFSEGGHMIAFANTDGIELYSSLDLKKRAELENIEGEVKDLFWKNNDKRLLILSENGNIYEWDVILKKKLWSSDGAIFLKLAIFKDNIYASSSDFKIWIFSNYNKKSADIDTQGKVSAILVIDEQMLLIGKENGMVCGYGSSTLFETFYHQKSIINMTLKENGKLLLVTGEDGSISMWKIDYESENSILLFDEVLIEQTLYDSNANMILQLEKELKEKTAASREKESQQLRLQETERMKLKKHCEDIQEQLKQTLTDLTDKKYNILADLEKNHSDQIASLQRERDENYADFQRKLEKENENMKKLAEDRVKKVDECEWQLFNLKEEIKASNERAYAVREKNESRLKDLELILQKEIDTRQETVKQNQKFYRDLEEKAKSLSEETNFKFAADLKQAKKQSQFMISELERSSAVLDYGKEYSRTLDAEFGKKKRIYDGLKRISDHIKDRICHINNDLQRKELVLEDKIAMIKVLEKDAKEMEHMCLEANWTLAECKRQLEEKSEELSNLLTEQEKLENEQRQLTRKLKHEQRKQFDNDEKLKATERSIADSTQKLLKAQLLFERYRKEFIDSTKGIESPNLLRWTLLRIFDKRVLRDYIKEEVFVGDTDPLQKFCRQRNHYESLMKIALNRKEEIKASFRVTYVNLAKENSDWTAFAEALKCDRQQKKERIQILETCLGLSAKDFGKDPSDTQKRFNNAYESLLSWERNEDEEIQKRMDLIEIQTKELQKLHGMIVVDERGKIMRKIVH